MGLKRISNLALYVLLKDFFFSFLTIFKLAHFIVLAIETGILLDLNRAYVIYERSLTKCHGPL